MNYYFKTALTLMTYQIGKSVVWGYIGKTFKKTALTPKQASRQPPYAEPWPLMIICPFMMSIVK